MGKWPIHIQVSHYATVACKRLERGGMGGKRPPRKPSVDEIEQAKVRHLLVVDFEKLKFLAKSGVKLAHHE